MFAITVFMSVRLDARSSSKLSVIRGRVRPNKSRVEKVEAPAAARVLHEEYVRRVGRQ
jgi:hypothetical protein